MTESTGIVFVLGLVALALVLGLIVKLTAVRTRHPDKRSATVNIADFGIETPGQESTVIQLSTVHCSRCPGVQRTITELVRDHRDVEFVHVDVTERPELVKKYQVMQTPTVLVLDNELNVHTRLSGALNRKLLFDAIFGDRPEGSKDYAI